MSRLGKWIFFFVACVASWLLAAIFIFVSGSAPCEAADSCTRDRIIGIIILLMLPLQAAIAAYMRYKEKEEEW